MTIIWHHTTIIWHKMTITWHHTTYNNHMTSDNNHIPSDDNYITSYNIQQSHDFRRQSHDIRWQLYNIIQHTAIIWHQTKIMIRFPHRAHDWLLSTTMRMTHKLTHSKSTADSSRILNEQYHYACMYIYTRSYTITNTRVRANAHIIHISANIYSWRVDYFLQTYI